MTLDLDALTEMADVYDSFAPDVVVDLIAEIRRLRENWADLEQRARAAQAGRPSRSGA